MRFLLHATKKAKSPSTSKRFGANSKNNAAAPTTTTSPASPASAAAATKAWGQQCSPHCGCVVRFESMLDANNVIVSASYHAKQIVTTTAVPQSDKDACRRHRRRQPHYTMTKNAKPLVQACSCDTLHTLCTQVTNYLLQAPNISLDHVRNLLLVGSSMSQAALVHTALKTQSLPVSHAPCFVLVQQALTAMVCGYLPKQQEPVLSYSHHLRQQHQQQHQQQYSYASSDTSTNTATTASTASLLEQHYEYHVANTNSLYGMDDSDDEDAAASTMGISSATGAAAAAAGSTAFSILDMTNDDDENEDAQDDATTTAHAAMMAKQTEQAAAALLSWWGMKRTGAAAAAASASNNENQEDDELNTKTVTSASSSILTWQDYVDEQLHVAEDRYNNSRRSFGWQRRRRHERSA